eukprot:516570-Rhodomonas_salina.1
MSVPRIDDSATPAYAMLVPRIAHVARRTLPCEIKCEKPRAPIQSTREGEIVIDSAPARSSRTR